MKSPIEIGGGAPNHPQMASLPGLNKKENNQCKCNLSIPAFVSILNYLIIFELDFPLL